MKVIQTLSIFAVLIACCYSNPIRSKALSNALKNGFKHIGSTSSKIYNTPGWREAFIVEKVWPSLKVRQMEVR